MRVEVREGVKEGRLLRVHQDHRCLERADALQRQRADLAVVLGQARLVEQPQQRLGVARHPLQRAPLLGQVDRGAHQVTQVRAVRGRDRMSDVLQRVDPILPTHPVVAPARGLERRQGRLDRDHLAHTVGGTRCQVERDVGSVAVSGDHRPPDLQRVEQAEQVTRHVVQRVSGGRNVAVAVAAQVIGEDAEVLCEHRDHLQVPGRKVAGDSMDQHEIRAVPQPLIVQAHAVVQRDLGQSSLPVLTRRNPGPAVAPPAPPAPQARARDRRPAR